MSVQRQDNVHAIAEKLKCTIVIKLESFQRNINKKHDCCYGTLEPLIFVTRTREPSWINRYKQRNMNVEK